MEKSWKNCCVNISIRIPLMPDVIKAETVQGKRFLFRVLGFYAIMKTVFSRQKEGSLEKYRDISEKQLSIEMVVFTG